MQQFFCVRKDQKPEKVFPFIYGLTLFSMFFIMALRNPKEELLHDP